MKNGVPNSGKCKRKMGTREKVTPSSGNVFADLSIPNPEQYLAKAELARRICALITERELTQAEAAALLGLGRTKMVALLRGVLDEFSSDRLFQFLNALGQDVEILIKPHRPPGRRVSTRVATS
jgi:predicted XRE-type DNA-binding protein